MKRTKILDLTRTLDQELPIYSEVGYSDPPLQVETWCTVAGQGYWVSRLSLGTQSGTHMDAPAHFVAGAADLSALPLSALLGEYYLLELKKSSTPSGYQGQPILFLRSCAPIEIPEATFTALLALPCRLWVIVHEISIQGRDAFFFNRTLAQSDKYLVENLDVETARQVKQGGELFALPLKLVDTSGAPCRVVVRQPA